MASMIEYRQMLAERDLAAVWPQWRVVRLLGAGAFGEVYEIQRNEYGRISRCALKILRKENAAPVNGDIYTHISRGNSSEEFITTVLKEIDIMEKLKGAPNIVVIDDYEVVRNSDSCSVLIRMELLRNLGEFMMSRQITVADIIRIGTDVCNALEYCEGQNIIHRDVKESNIFYSDMGMFKLGDFGISRQLIANNATMTSAGTVSKMAPEVYKGEKYDSRVDIYSLGIVLYSLLNYGRPPFYPPYPAEVTTEAAYEADMTRIKGAAIPPLAGVDDRLNRIVCKACHPKPSARYRSAAEFREALLNYYDEISGREPTVKKTILSGLRRDKTSETYAQEMTVPGQAVTETVVVQRTDGTGMNGEYYDPQSMSDGGGRSNLVPGLVLIAAIVVIVGSLVVWNSTRNRKSPGGSSNPPDYVAQNTVETPETPQENTEENVEEVEDHFLHADWSDEEDSTGGGGGGSGLSTKRLGDVINSSGGSDEVKEEEDGVYSLIDDDGNTVAKVETPSWASRTDTDSGSLTFSNSEGLAVFQHIGTASSDTYVSFLKDAIKDDGIGFKNHEIIDEGSSETGGLSVKWVKTTFDDDGLLGTAFWGAVDCEKGCIQIVSMRISKNSLPDFSESEYLEDVDCITLEE